MTTGSLPLVRAGADSLADEIRSMPPAARVADVIAEQAGRLA